MKKYFIFLFVIFLLMGCSKNEEVTCIINNKKATFALKRGIIVKYKLDGKEKKNYEIDEINGTYFTSSENNEEGKIVLKSYVESLGGTCNE
ncbi:MAG: hypothetical protein IKG27_00610 [Bacilli bacterium]|nr:hypothetical protein [Bacilli bacterium]